MRNEIQRWELSRQRDALSRLPEREFRETPEFVALLEQIDNFHARGLVNRARFQEGYPLEAQEAVNMILVNLLKEIEPGKYLADVVAAAEDPFALLGHLAFQQWLPKEHGIRGHNLEVPEILSAPATRESSSHLTDLDLVVELCHEVLHPRTPVELHSQLRELLGFLAANPPQRLSYERFERQAAAKYCPSFSESQIAAVMNIAWGGRGHRAETSLMGQFLFDADFKPEDSPTHYRALRYYQNEITARTDGSRQLGKGK